MCKRALPAANICATKGGSGPSVAKENAVSLDPFDSLQYSFLRDPSFCEDKNSPPDPDCPNYWNEVYDYSNRIVAEGMIEDYWAAVANGSAPEGDLPEGLIFALHNYGPHAIGAGVTATQMPDRFGWYRLIDSDGNEIGVYRFVGEEMPEGANPSNYYFVSGNGTNSVWTNTTET